MQEWSNPARDYVSRMRLISPLLAFRLVGWKLRTFPLMMDAEMVSESLPFFLQLA
jgi:hypothetical protein